MQEVYCGHRISPLCAAECVLLKNSCVFRLEVARVRVGREVLAFNSLVAPFGTAECVSFGLI